MRLEVLAGVSRAAADIFQVVRSSRADDVVGQQDAAFPEEATLLDKTGKKAVIVEGSRVSSVTNRAAKKDIASILTVRDMRHHCTF